ncbi:diguanylate cyclase [Luteibacter sp. W1I16]|uniref:GGDEF domain-containing protein n=1 Tax=Luteibacter sp. W1I16 TaxID=3373922 RepID=UPI003D25A50A
MGSCLEQDVWERKYHLALERMERDERDFRALEEGLRRLALRLAVLARGQDRELDGLLDHLASELRHVPSLAALEPLLDALATAVASADDLPPAGGESDAASIDGLRADIARLQELLAAVSLRLGDMTRYLAVELERAALDDREGRALDATVREEMRALGETTLAAADLGSLQAEVAERLSLIDRHFREYREREDARLAAYRDRAERMRDRVQELENQATSLQDSLRREHELALTDGLTSLPNRLAYERRVAEVEREVREGGGTACLGAFDIDHFKSINDTYGHGAGDAVLRIVGQTLARELEGRAFVARYGGEEFAVVFAGMDTGAAGQLARELCATVEKLAFHASSRPVTVTMSGGITRFGVDDTAAAAFDRADRALYAAKRAGRNRCVLL